MATIQERIRALIEDCIVAGTPVDIHQVAEVVQLEYPEHALDDIAALATELLFEMPDHSTAEKKPDKQ
jgi:hypothetical protein